MEDMMIVDDGKLMFYTFETGKDIDIDFNIIGGNDLVSLYKYYMNLLNSEGLYDIQILIEKYIRELNFYVDYTLSFQNSIDEYNENKAPEHIVEIIDEGIENKRILNFFVNNGLLIQKQKTLVKK